MENKGWLILSVFLGLLGGIIAYAMPIHKQPDAARACLILARALVHIVEALG